MRISVLTIGAVASILSINSVFATTSTVTSKDYVDAADALKQNKIPAAGTNSSTPGSTVVTYTSTAGTIGERGIVEPTGDYAGENALVTLGVVSEIVDEITETIDTIQDDMPDFNDLPETTVTYKTCVGWSNEFQTDANCILWDLSDAKVYGKCHSNSDCNGYCVACVNGQCIEDSEHCLL